MVDVLPDCRLKIPVATQMVDWPCPDGTTVRIEVEIAYCANCGKEYAWVPKENTIEFFCLCKECFNTHGAIAGTYVQSDEEFRQSVGAELQARYGRTLTELEVYNEIRDHNLGPALEALIRDSRIPSLDNRPKR